MKKPIFEWFEEILESDIESEIEVTQEVSNKTITREEAIEQLNTSPTFWQDYWDMEMEFLTELLNEKNPDGYWKAQVKGFGWRNLDGEKYFQADNASDFLRELSPDTNNHFRIYRWRNGFSIQNYHHDSPTGNEWYYVVPIKASTYEKNN